MITRSFLVRVISLWIGILSIVSASCQPTLAAQPTTQPEQIKSTSTISVIHQKPTVTAAVNTPCALLDDQPLSPLTTPPALTEQSGREYYFDSETGDDRNTGTDPLHPWKSLKFMNSFNFLPGDTIHLKRGSVWEGAFFIWASGSEDRPITYTSYGESGALPTFHNPGNGRDLTSVIRITADWVVVNQLNISDARLAGIYIANGAEHNLIQQNEISGVGEGVSIHGRYNRILGNYIHDLKMVQNTPGGNDDYGAIGVWLFNSYNEVAFNRLIHLKARSYDYGEDGGAIEFYKQVDRSTIHHNYVYDSDGFLEIGGASASDNRVYYNLIVNSGRLLGIHLGGKFASKVSGLRFDNNTVVDTLDRNNISAIQFWWGTPTRDTLSLKNNIFYIPLFKELSAPAEITIDHNLIFNKSGLIPDLNYTWDEKNDPLFINMACGDYQLATGSAAIDAGVDLGYTTDLAGRSLKKGNPPDLGAYGTDLH